jgi:hypothetical protein
MNRAPHLHSRGTGPHTYILEEQGPTLTFQKNGAPHLHSRGTGPHTYIPEERGPTLTFQRNRAPHLRSRTTGPHTYIPEEQYSERSISLFPTTRRVTVGVSEPACTRTHRGSVGQSHLVSTCYLKPMVRFFFPV